VAAISFSQIKQVRQPVFQTAAKMVPGNFLYGIINCINAMPPGSVWNDGDKNVRPQLPILAYRFTIGYAHQVKAC